MAERITSGLVTKTVDAALAAAQLRSPSSDAIRHLNDKVKASLVRQLEQTYKRLAEVKNLLYRAKPALLERIFVSPRLKHCQDTLDQDSLLLALDEGRRIIVRGSAGFGKSVLLKHMVLCYLNNSRKKIPLFVELRKVPADGNVLEHLRQIYSKGRNKLSEEEFLAACDEGYFDIYLDGFDEVPEERRNKVAESILDIGFSYPNLGLLVSGRNDQSFAGWEQFHIYDILPLTRAKTKELISKLDYNADLRKKFLKKLDENFLKEQDESFISTPLMAVLMLLTYELFADIPNKVHLFYGQAFETLLRGHDATKSQFRRDLSSLLPDDLFKKVFAAFCALTYAKAAFQFSQSDIVGSLRMTLDSLGLSADPSAVLTDLTDNVCVLQYEGLEFSFVHRSFQEYFAAVYLQSSPTEIVDKYLRVKRVAQDGSVVAMLLEMDRDRIEEEWVAPELRRFLADAEAKTPEEFTRDFWQEMHMESYGDSLFSFRTPQGGYNGTYPIIWAMYGRPYGHREYYFDDWEEYTRRAFRLFEMYDAGDLSRANVGSGTHGRSTERSGRRIEIQLSEQDDHWLRELGFVDLTIRVIDQFRRILTEVEGRTQARHSFAQGFFED